MENFYDRMGKKFGGYAFGKHRAKYLHECPDGYPEEIFKEKLLSVSGPDKLALDIGCGDGKFAFEVSNYFLNIIGIDNSKVLLEIAKNKKKEKNVENVSFQFANAKSLPFENEFFDVAFNRRGPTSYPEYFRVLKNGGFYIEIGVAEKDAVDLKKVFGRGQGYGNWNKSRLVSDTKELKSLGFKIIYAKEIYCNEYYPSLAELDIFLQSVPIFEDYDSEADRKHLEIYCKKYQTEKGIILPRHRVVYLAQR